MPDLTSEVLDRTKPGPYKRLTAALSKLYHRARFHAILRWRYNRLTIETVAGRRFVVLPDVFNPKLMITGETFARMLTSDLIAPESRVLELGTGSGIGAIQAASLEANVVALDINPEAVRCARINALLNRVEAKVEVHQSDLFASVAGERFDVVLFHPPFYEGEPEGGLEYAWQYGDIPQRFAGELAEHLNPGGCALLFLTNTGGWLTFLQALELRGYACTVVATKELGFETARLFRVEPNGGQ